jgi:hypothetical protein
LGADLVGVKRFLTKQDQTHPVSAAALGELPTVKLVQILPVVHRIKVALAGVLVLVTTPQTDPRPQVALEPMLRVEAVLPVSHPPITMQPLAQTVFHLALGAAVVAAHLLRVQAATAVTAVLLPVGVVAVMEDQRILALVAMAATAFAVSTLGKVTT